MDKILCIDTGAKMGWALRYNYDITSGTYSLKTTSKENTGLKFEKFRLFLDETYNRCDGLYAIYYEDIAQKQYASSCIAYGGYLGILSSWCERKHVRYYPIPISSVRHNLGVTRRFNKGGIKRTVIETVKECGYSPKDDNEADALALMIYYLDHYD